MPITRRRRANPPDQPENNHHQPVEQTEGTGEQPLNAEPAPALPPVESGRLLDVPGPQEPVLENNTTGTGGAEPGPNSSEGAQAPLPASNGDRSTPEYTQPIEGGRRTARGELFRRPPQAPLPVQNNSFVTAAPLQAPTHEITLPLGNLLHLAYNPGYTGSEEARGLLLHRLSEESKSGGRARCWNCGSLGIVYDRWNTRNRTFGDVGIAFCEVCGVWSVM